MCPECACAGKPALDLIVDEHGADLVAAVAKGLQEGLGGDVDAAFALDGLDEDTACLGGDEVRDGGFVVEGPVAEAGEHGGEGFLVFGIGRRGEGAHCAAVEGVVEGDDFVL